MQKSMLLISEDQLNISTYFLISFVSNIDFVLSWKKGLERGYYENISNKG
jgi:hypothetical protein